MEGGRKRRRFISRTTRKCWNGAVVPSSRVDRRCVATRVCVSLAWTTVQGQSRRRALLCATGAPSPTSTPRFARSGSTLKRGIYRGDSFRLRSCSPLKENSSSSFLKRTRPPRHKRRASRDEGLSRESNRNPFISVSKGILFIIYPAFIEHYFNPSSFSICILFFYSVQLS